MSTSRAIWDDGSLTFEERLAAQEELGQEYYKEKRDKSAREKSKAGPSNLDENNITILKAELKNLLLLKGTRADKAKPRIAELRRKIEELEQ